VNSRPGSAGALFFAAVIAVTALGPLTLHLALPAFPAIQRDLNASLATLQLAISLAMLTMAFATLVYGPLSDRLGRRPVLLAGLTLFVIGSVICTVAPTITLLIFGRFVQAAGAACGTVIARAMLSDVYSRERLAAMIGYVTAAYVVAPAVAAPMGGMLVHVFDWRAVFTFATIVGAIILAGAVFLLEETNRHPVPGRGLTQLVRGNLQVLRLPGFYVYALFLGLGSGGFFAFLGAAPYLVIELQGRSTAEYGVYFLFIPFGYFLGSLTCGRLGGRFRAHQMVLAGSVFAAFWVVTMVIWVSLDPDSTVALFLCTGMMTMGGGISTPHAQAAAISRAGNLAGTASGMLVFMQWACGALFAQLVGMIADGTPYPALAVIAICALSSTAVAVIVVRNARRAAP
jgi:DHA1 family bicyclomycin/chloramphenicol resistance-like MFS transporter